MTYPSKSMPNS